VFNKNISVEVSNERASTQLNDERGSATTEFVLLALPLFLPALLFFLSLSNSANTQGISKK